MQKIDRVFIDHILKNVSMVEYLEKEYDLDFIYNRKSNWFNTNCPMPDHDDSSPSFGVNNETNLFHCFGCGEKGDLIKLIQKVEGLNFVESIQKIADFAGIDIELVNLDIKSIIKDLKNHISEYLTENNSNPYPGNLSEIGFLIAFSERTKKHIRKNNFDIQEINWTDSLYKQIEIFSEQQDYKSIDKLWLNFSKMCKERLINNESS